MASESPEIKQSPNASKAAGRRQQRQKPLHVPDDHGPQITVPKSSVNEYGVPSQVLSLLEVSPSKHYVQPKKNMLRSPQKAEVVSAMQPLFHFAQSRPNLSAHEALQQICISIQQQAQNHNQNPAVFNPAMQQQPLHNPNLQLPNSGQRTPSMNGPNHFVSPAQAAHLNLPTSSASPATLNMSPAVQNLALQHQHQQQNHLANTNQLLQHPPTSVSMVAQQSQQGTNNSGTGSQGTSANASPNVNKRRRASAVKIEGDEGGGEVNGVVGKVKQSPRVPKKQKTNG